MFRHVFLAVQDNATEFLICMCVRGRHVFAYAWVCVHRAWQRVYSGHVCLCKYICLFNPLLSGQMKSDLVKEVAYTRRKQHSASLQYYCALNALQYRKRVAMLEPMLGYTQAQVLSSCWPANWARPHDHYQYWNWVFKNGKRFPHRNWSNLHWKVVSVICARAI